MRIHRDKLATRLFGTATGSGFVLIGLYSIFGAGGGLDEYTLDRTLWFGITSIAGGALAIGLSLFVRRLDNIWCAPPARGIFRRKKSGSE